MRGSINYALNFIHFWPKCVTDSDQATNDANHKLNFTHCFYPLMF